MAPFPRVITSYLCWVDYIGPLLSWKVLNFVLIGIDTIVDTDLLFLYAMPLPKISSMYLQNVLSIVLHKTLFLIKELT